MSLRYLFDDHLGDLARALRRRALHLTIWRVGEHDALDRAASDVDIPRWCAIHDAVLVSRDASTLEAHLAEVQADGVRVPGVIIANRSMGMAETLELLVLVAEHLEPDDLGGVVRYLRSFS